jgi:CrcB protein
MRANIRINVVNIAHYELLDGGTPVQVAWSIACIAIGGALGALSRYGLYLWLNQPNQPSLPIGTLVANGVGCFLAGFIIAVGGTEKSEWIRLGVGVGFLGALTTFSTFGIETVNHIKLNHYGLAIANVVLNLTVSLGMVVLGAALGRLFRSAG